jgi:O-antigen/teichoic acid export membrane protein
VQAVYFVLIARSLGAGNYGEFVGISALMTIFNPFAGNGAGQLLVQHTAIDNARFRIYWGNGLVLTAGSGLLLAVFAMALAPFVLPRTIPLVLIAILSLTDIVILKLCDYAAMAYQAVERLDRYAQLTVLPTVARLVAVLAMALTVQSPSALAWGKFYLGSTIAAAIVALVAACFELDAPCFALRQIPKEMADGFFFALSTSASSIYNDIDKTMLARLSTLSATGIYGAAYRIIEVAFSPSKSLLQAAYPRFFQHGKKGIAASLRFGWSLVQRAGIVAVAIFVMLVVGAPLMPHVLGHEFSDCVGALRWLALLPLFKTVHALMADVLTGAGHQRLRAALQVFIAIANVLINLWWIPRWGWKGAAWSSLVSDGALAVLMYLAALLLSRAEVRRSAQSSAAAIRTVSASESWP